MRRTRGFLFLSFGLVVASQAGASRLSVYENGIGALNLPYERGSLGVPNSRAVHPKTLRLVAELFSTVTGKLIEVENPHALQTKSQMCRALPGALRSLISSTYSCDSSGARRSASKQCGTCTSCLLRRSALHASSLSEDTSDYARDVRSPNFSGKRRHMKGLDAMTWQVERVAACLEKAEPWHALLREFPELQSAAKELQLQNPQVEISGEFMALYERHCRDWRSFMPLNWPGSLRKAA